MSAAITLITTDSEIDEVSRIGEFFFLEGGLPGRLKPEVVRRNWRGFIDSGSGAIFGVRSVSGDRAGELVGALGALIYPDINDGDLVATETFWYVLPEHRGVGIPLLDTFESWAKLRGARRIMMAHLRDLMPEKLASLYLRRGYRPVETNYIKEAA